MRSTRRRSQRLVLVFMGLAGMLAAHALAYWVVIGDARHRHELLVESGHGYWPHAILVGVFAGVVAGIATAASAASSAPAARRASLVPDVVPLALAQSGGFLALEAIERLGSGAGAGTMLEPLIVVGLAIQVAVSIAAVLALRLIERVGALIGDGSRERRSVRASRAFPRPVEGILAPRWVVAFAPARAPPARTP